MLHGYTCVNYKNIPRCTIFNSLYHAYVFIPYNTMNNPSAHPSYSHYYLLSPSTLFFFCFFVHLIVFFAHLVVFLHISLSFAHLIVFCTSYCFALFYFIAHFTLISPFLTICMPLCYVTYTICILIVLHCPLSGPDSIAFHF